MAHFKPDILAGFRKGDFVSVYPVHSAAWGRFNGIVLDWKDAVLKFKLPNGQFVNVALTEVGKVEGIPDA